MGQTPPRVGLACFIVRFVRRPLVTAGVPGGEGAEGPQQVGDGPSAEGQDGGASEQDEAVGGRARAGRFEGVEDGVDLGRELLMNLIESASRRTGLAGLLAAGGPEPFAELLRGQPLSGPVG